VRGFLHQYSWTRTRAMLPPHGRNLSDQLLSVGDGVSATRSTGRATPGPPTPVNPKGNAGIALNTKNGTRNVQALAGWRERARIIGWMTVFDPMPVATLARFDLRAPRRDSPKMLATHRSIRAGGNRGHCWNRASRDVLSPPLAVASARIKRKGRRARPPIPIQVQSAETVSLLWGKIGQKVKSQQEKSSSRGTLQASGDPLGRQGAVGAENYAATENCNTARLARREPERRPLHHGHRRLRMSARPFS